MSLLSGSVSISRFNVVRRPVRLDFEEARFEPISPDAEESVSCGFVPFRPGADYRVGSQRWAFRVRMDRLRPDPTRVRERLRELVRADSANGDEAVGVTGIVGPTRRRELRRRAVEEIAATTSPTSRIFECLLDEDVLYVAATAVAQLRIVAEQLQRLGVVIAPKTPWADRDADSRESVVAFAEGEADPAIGSRLMEELVGDSELTIAPENGRLKLATAETEITLSGVVIHELLHFLERKASILAARMATEGATFDFDVRRFRITNLRIEAEPRPDWEAQLNERLEKISEIFEILDLKYYNLSH